MFCSGGADQMMVVIPVHIPLRLGGQLQESVPTRKTPKKPDTRSPFVVTYGFVWYGYWNEVACCW